jgi:NAD(P)-dependent dehydrogenase (short-subunit alcohol dehydrogenase family)
MSRPSNQVVVVTGASGGIGRAVAQAYGARGARVAPSIAVGVLKRVDVDAVDDGFLVLPLRHEPCFPYFATISPQRPRQSPARPAVRRSGAPSR